LNFLLKYRIFEKTSLIKLGIPSNVMKDIQKNCEISDNAEWKKILKKDIRSILKKNEKNLIVCVSDNYVCVIFSLNLNFYIDTYALIDKDDFSNGYWVKEQRKKLYVSDIIKDIKKSNYFLLVNGEWKYEPFKSRKLKNAEEKFDSKTQDFIEYFQQNYVKFINNYGQNSEKVKDIINNKLQQKNSLNKFDEYLISFENEYSEKYNEYLTMPILVDEYGYDKILTAFIYYLYSKKLINL